jgi:hypothetical protein
VNCDGTASDVILNTSCTVDVSDLKAAPFELPWGSHIWAKVLAINIVGESEYSSPGNGG